MSLTKNLIDAIEAKDASQIESSFEAAIKQRVSDRLNTQRQELASSMFNTISTPETE